MGGEFETMYVSHTTIRTQRALAALHFAVEHHIPEDEAVRDVSETFGIWPDVARTFLEYVKEHPDPNEW